MMDEATEESGQEFISMAEEVARHFRKFQQLRQKLNAIPRALKPKQHATCFGKRSARGCGCRGASGRSAFRGLSCGTSPRRSGRRWKN